MTNGRLTDVFIAIDAVNARDPERVVVEGSAFPANLIYGRRMTSELAAFAPDASELLQIAVRGQHIERWAIPRESRPRTRAGYLAWRRDLKEHHAALLKDIMSTLRYQSEEIERVGALVRKLRLASDPETQVLEDVVCIVFLKYEIDAFLGKYAGDEAKLAGILAKTWGKMSERGRAAALAIPPAPHVVALLQRGLAAIGA